VVVWSATPVASLPSRRSAAPFVLITPGTLPLQRPFFSPSIVGLPGEAPFRVPFNPKPLPQYSRHTVSSFLPFFLYVFSRTSIVFDDEFPADLPWYALREELILSITPLPPRKPERPTSGDPVFSPRFFLLAFFLPVGVIL